jgi:8-oxo-dGTP pyrophosphatase MutT (NUDIX family)
MGRRSKRAIREAAGCIAYYRDEGGALRLLLIRDRQDVWTLPKGHLLPGESDAAAAARELFEETGVAGELGPAVGQIEYPVVRCGVPCTKRVRFFLLRADSPALTPDPEEVRAAVWLAPDEALARVGYPLVRQVLAAALALLGASAADR